MELNIVCLALLLQQCHSEASTVESVDDVQTKLM